MGTRCGAPTRCRSTASERRGAFARRVDGVAGPSQLSRRRDRGPARRGVVADVMDSVEPPRGGCPLRCDRTHLFEVRAARAARRLSIWARRALLTPMPSRPEAHSGIGARSRPGVARRSRALARAELRRAGRGARLRSYRAVPLQVRAGNGRIARVTRIRMIIDEASRRVRR